MSPSADNKLRDQHLRELLCLLSSGEMTLPEARRLDELISADQSARQFYLDFMTVEAELHAKHSFDSTGRSLPDASGPHLSKTGRRLGEVLDRFHFPSWLTIAATLLGVAVLSSAATIGWVGGLASRDQPRQPLAQVSPAPRDIQSSIGAISATRNCRWTTHNGGCGDLVHKGQRLSLQQGVAEITFNTSAKVLLEGPAVLQIDQQGGVELLSGRLAVDSPQDVESLPICAGRIRIADQGAAYGLIAESTGAGEVHVFRGVVLAALINRLGEQVHTCELTSGNGGRLSTAANRIEPILAVNDLFVRSLSPGSGARDGLYAFEGFDYTAGPLSEQNGGFGWAGAWADIETAYADSGDSTNVVQERSLTWPGVPPIGNRAFQAGQANRIRRVLSMSVKGVFDTAGYVENRDAHRLIGREGKTIYVAFLQRVSKMNEVFYGLELNRGDGNRNRVLCIGNGVEQSGYAVTSNYNGYIDEKALTLGKEDTDVNLFVVRIDFGADDQDLATVYRNPESLVEEKACQPAGVIKGNFSFDRVSLGNFNGAKIHEVDDLRIGGDFRVVTGQRSFIQGQLAGASQRPTLASFSMSKSHSPARLLGGLWESSRSWR